MRGLTGREKFGRMIEQERRVMKMEKIQSLNGFLASLPRMKKRSKYVINIGGIDVAAVKVWKKQTAIEYVEKTYPGQAYTLRYWGKAL